MLKTPEFAKKDKKLEKDMDIEKSKIQTKNSVQMESMNYELNVPNHLLRSEKLAEEMDVNGERDDDCIVSEAQDSVSEILTSINV